MANEQIIGQLKYRVQFRNSKDKILKDCWLTRIPNIEEKIVLDFKNEQNKKTITSDQVCRVYDIVCLIDEQNNEAYVIYAEKLDHYYKLLQQTKEGV